MPLPDYADLNRNPGGLLTYLESNLIITDQLPNSESANTPEYLVLEPARMYPKSEVYRTGKKIEGGAVDVYSLVRSADAKTSSKALHAYICDYEKNHIRGCALGKAAGFCFTITMNGCTFGIGTASPDGTVLVTHSNRAEAENQRSEQFDAVVTTHGSKNLAGMLNPAIYRPQRGMTSTTIGIRTSKGWQFYFQSWKLDSGNAILYGTMPVPANQNHT